MSGHRCLLMGMVLAMLPQLAYVATAAAQGQAMPPSTSPADSSASVYGGLGALPQVQPPSNGEIRIPGYPQPEDDWTWQVLPTNVIWKSYLADAKDSRLGSELVYDKYQGWFWDATLGGRVGLLRYGTANPAWPEGFELDVEGAAFPRLDSDRSVIGTDFRAGCPFTYRQGQWEMKFAYQHECSHLGDLYIEENPGVTRINFIRDELVLGVAYRPFPGCGSTPRSAGPFTSMAGPSPGICSWRRVQLRCSTTAFSGSPFFAVNTRLRQELNFGGAFTVEAGWQWTATSRPEDPHRVVLLQWYEQPVPVVPDLREPDRRRTVVRLLDDCDGHLVDWRVLVGRRGILPTFGRSTGETSAGIGYASAYHSGFGITHASVPAT